MIAVVSGLVGFYALLAVCLWRRERRRPLERDQIIAAARARVWDADGQRWATVHEVGPDPLKLIVDLEQDLKAYAATVADLYDPIRDEDNHTTNPTGDQ